ncbi:GNAT family N-acetyltransferase [Promicromonospora sukumoe]|uniref:GNAT family N-acetyltransferase n=1 Tax=Promicromonospora sukumoe TaxID=88382 RepID=UPI003669F63C
MADLGPLTWPPAPISTERLLLRQPEPRDRAAIIELGASDEVNAYVGGARPRDELEREISATPQARSGQFVVDLDGAMIGLVQLDRRAGNHEFGPALGRVELGYLFLPDAWGQGYAAEACAAVLGWFDDAVPDEPVVLVTQTANERSMRLAKRLGFTEVQLFEAWGAEQWFGERPAAAAASAN